MDAQQFTQIISQVGFPIFVAVWLLWKGDQQNKAIVEALNKLENAINALMIRLEDKVNNK